MQRNSATGYESVRTRERTNWVEQDGGGPTQGQRQVRKMEYKRGGGGEERREGEEAGICERKRREERGCKEVRKF